ncbi:MAG: extracellular solute-binding protein [bacterium]|nr:extracellular solute-binding protein [bacterium]MDZ4295781.1 extracellular solute-binding protein [Patescibacteria group bacterium]
MELPQFTRSQLIVFAGIGGVLLVGVLMVAGVIPGLRTQTVKPDPVDLTFWGVHGSEDAYKPLIDAYRSFASHVTITYVEKSPLTYERDLLNALAAGEGPDLFMVRNRAIPRWQDKIAPAPVEYFTPAEMDEIFADVASFDLARGGLVWGVPFSIDTLALFYNRDLFNDARITAPPRTWAEFDRAVQALTRRDESGNIERSGVALGTAQNINRAADILALLLLQQGSPVTKAENGAAVFDLSTTRAGKVFMPGETALTQYTAFSDPRDLRYAWNGRQHHSIDAFIEGNTAMMLNYSYQIPTIKDRAPHLRFAVAPAPQRDGRESDVAFANYWAYTVAKNSQNPGEAWRFLAYATSKDVLAEYLNQNGLPAARRDLLEEQFNDRAIDPFANQVLVARSYYTVDNLLVETVLDAMIEEVARRQSTAKTAIDRAVQKINVGILR